jgi:polysaccharide biosynthesis protein PslG
MGAGSVRLDVGWTNVEPGDGMWDESYLTRLKRYIDAVKAAKMDVLVVFQASPAWATANGKSEAPPRDPSRFGRAIGELAKRLKGSVAAYEIWNEADSRDFFTGTTDEYVRLLQAAYPAVHAADPTALVVLSGPSSVDAEWLRSLYRSGAKGFFDIAAVHPYPSPADMPPDNSIASRFSFEWLPRFREVMTENGDSSPVWITEIGWSAHANTGSEFPWERGVTEEQQAAYSRRVLSKTVESFPWITRIYFYNARDRVDQNVHQANFGLLRRDLSPKPVYSWLKDTITSLPA